MAENATIEEKNETVTETELGTPQVESEEATKLEAEKAELEDQVRGLKGTIESLRKQGRKGVEQETVDVEAIKAELESSFETKLKENIKPVIEENEKLRKSLIEANDKELKAKKAALDSINARMASASGSKGQSSSDSIVENEVELSNDEREIAKQVGLTNPRYLKDVEVRGN